MEKQDPPIDKARLKAALEQAQTSLINYPGFSPEQLKVMADAKEAINQRMTAMGEAMRKAFEPFNAEILDRMAELGRALSEALQKNKDGYHREIKSFFAFLTKNGYIIPADYEDFADWFFYEKHPDLPLNIEGLRTLATVKESHFREFHEWKEAKFLAKEQPPAPLPPGKLFVDGKGDKVQKAAKAAGVIDERGKSLLGERYKWVIPAIADHLYRKAYFNEGRTIQDAAHALAAYWGTTISGTTIGSVQGLAPNSLKEKRGAHLFQAFLSELSGN